MKREVPELQLYTVYHLHARARPRALSLKARSFARWWKGAFPSRRLINNHGDTISAYLAVRCETRQAGGKGPGMAAGRSGGEVGCGGLRCWDRGKEKKWENERERGSAVVIDGQLCLPPEPFIKIQRGWLTSLLWPRRPTGYQATPPTLCRVRACLRMYTGIGNPRNRLLKFLPTRARLAAATRRDTTAVGFERQIAE